MAEQREPVHDCGTYLFPCEQVEQIIRRQAQ